MRYDPFYRLFKYHYKKHLKKNMRITLQFKLSMLSLGIIK